MKRLVLAFLFIATLTASAATPAALHLRLGATETLPALPVDFLIEVDNPSDKDFVVEAFILEVEGAKFSFVSRRGVDVDGSRLSIRVPANASISHHLSVEPTLDGNFWFAESRLSEPGTYKLRLHGYDEATAKLINTPQDLIAHMPIVSSPTVQLVVRPPQGIDATVFEKIRQVNPALLPTYWGGRWGQNLATEIWSNYPDSTYAKHVALLVNVPLDESEEHIERVRARYPAGPLADWYDFYPLYRRAQWLDRQIGYNVDGKPSLAQNEDLNEIASASRKLATVTKNGAVKSHAEKLVDRLLEKSNRRTQHAE